MRFTAFVFLFTSMGLAQNLTEFGAAVAGGSVGGASGKQVSDGVTSIFEKVGGQTAKAANAKKKEKPAEPALKVAPGVATLETGDVPPPPVANRRDVTPPRVPSKAAIPADVTEATSNNAVAPALPPPPEMSPEDLKTVTSGMSRVDVLKFGAPASRITMFDNGHLSETFSYRQNGRKIGTVHLTDGAVASVEAQ